MDTSVKMRKNIYILLSLTVILDVSGSLIKKNTLTRYQITQWISKLPGSIKIRWVRQYMVNFIAPVGIANATLY